MTTTTPADDVATAAAGTPIARLRAHRRLQLRGPRRPLRRRRVALPAALRQPGGVRPDPGPRRRPLVHPPDDRVHRRAPLPPGHPGARDDLPHRERRGAPASTRMAVPVGQRGHDLGPRRAPRAPAARRGRSRGRSRWPWSWPRGPSTAWSRRWPAWRATAPGPSAAPTASRLRAGVPLSLEEGDDHGGVHPRRRRAGRIRDALGRARGPQPDGLRAGRGGRPPGGHRARPGGPGRASTTPTTALTATWCA